MSDSVSTAKNRIGFQYFPDSLHYREEDSSIWLPKLIEMGASWLILKTSVDRAIPENFLRKTISSGITPILHFDELPLSSAVINPDLDFMLETYKKWGAKYVCFFDRPNLIKSWSGESWGQFSLVERFLEMFLPLAETAASKNLIPVFPALEPGGDYWDTAFLRKALELINQNASEQVNNSLVLGAYAWTHNQPMNWGAGGPERWPGSKPYFTPKGEEDQRGFRVFDWYNAISSAIFNEKKPILLMGAGCRANDNVHPEYPKLTPELHTLRNARTADLLIGAQASDEAGELLEPIPDNVLCGNFWLLSTKENAPEQANAWYPSPSDPLPAVNELQIIAQREGINKPRDIPAPPAEPKTLAQAKTVRRSETHQTEVVSTKPNGIDHYLLLPLYEWGVADWHLEVIKPFVKRHQPTIGFSLYEAMGAKNVTVVSGKNGFPENELEKLYSSGCKVRIISGDGTEIASKLANM